MSKKRTRIVDEYREEICAWLTANGINPRHVPHDAQPSIADGNLTIRMHKLNGQERAMGSTRPWPATRAHRHRASDSAANARRGAVDDAELSNVRAMIRTAPATPDTPSSNAVLAETISTS